VTKSELIENLAKKFPTLSAGDSQLAVGLLFDAMAKTLSDGSRVEVRGFGSFTLNFRPERVGRNPKSGEVVMVPEKYVPHFRPGKELRQRVDMRVADQ
jgi:integration host factor subunit beta